MRITAIETIHLARGITVNFGPIQWLWVRIHTDTGLTGLGETYPHPEAEKAVILRSLAPVLLGRDPLEIDRLWLDMFQTISYSGWAGAELRAISAVDIALWDLVGKAANMPVYQMLGGASRSTIRTYNTCYDHIDFLTDPVRLARELAQSGIRAMKIWPFDPIAKLTGGQFITADQMRQGIEPLRLIRKSLEIPWMSRWNFTATGICRAPSKLRRRSSRIHRCGWKRCSRRTTRRLTGNWPAPHACPYVSASD